MKKEYPFLHFNSLLVFLSIVFFVSCTPVKNVVYFENLPRDKTLHNQVSNNLELKIRKNDLLNISIISPDPVSTPLFNGIPSSGVASSATTPGATGGYLVDNNGNIIVYKLGVIHAEGLTRGELAQLLKKKLDPAYLLDAVVTVRFVNNHVTVLGEVNHPQVIQMLTEQLTLLEAIGQSGDLTISGRRDNVLVIRETEDGKQFKRINLTDNSIFNSPFYYLKPDDVVYVEPTKTRIRNAGDTPQIVGYVLSGVSIAITILINLLRK